MTELSTSTDTRCGSCQATVLPTDAFCEACGAELTPSPDTATVEPAPGAPTQEMPVAGPVPGNLSTTCMACGGTIADDGYCQTCGARAVKPRDHYREQPAPWVAGVCDRGIRHHRNEDAMALAADPPPAARRAVLVVCDGVSSSTDSDVASLAAAAAARAVLTSSRARGMGTQAAVLGAVVGRLGLAVDAANDAVAATTASGASGNPPSCTFVAAVIQDDLLVTGSVGDSRAYWLPDAGEAVALTVDDSWAQEQVAAGMSREQAETGPHAHAITRWLGVDAPDHTPVTSSMTLPEAGWVLVCSDGLWNYCSEAVDLAALVARLSAQASEPLALAAALVDWANAQGGQDNITVALARIDRPS